MQEKLYRGACVDDWWGELVGLSGKEGKGLGGGGKGGEIIGWNIYMK